MGFRFGKRPTCRTLLQALTRRCRSPLHRGVRQSQADRYVKRHRSVEFALALVMHFLLGLSSLRQLKERLDLDVRLRRHVRLIAISHAQLPKLLNARPSELWAPLVAELLRQLSRQHVPSSLRLMDTSFFTMSVKLFSRVHGQQYAPEAAGLKLGLVLDPDNGAPVQWHCRMGQGNDVQQLADLVPPGAPIRGLTYLFDRGFRKYSFYADLVQRQADFITRATRQMAYRRLACHALDPAHPQILADERVQLGWRADRTPRLPPLRRIVLQTETQTLVFLTSRLDLSAFEVTELYRRRWEIETFFRWLKRVIGCHKALAYGARAAEHTIYAAIVTYLLALLLADIETSRHTQRPTYRIRRALTHIGALLYSRPQREHLRAVGFV